MARTVIASATTQVTVDASIVFDDASGVPTITRGTDVMARDSGVAWEQAARQIAVVKATGYIASNLQIIVIDGGLCVVPRVFGPGSALSRATILFRAAELKDFAQARFGSVTPLNSWTFDSNILGVIGDYGPADFIFLGDLSAPVTPAQLQPYCKGAGGRGIFHPGGFLAGTAL